MQNKNLRKTEKISKKDFTFLLAKLATAFREVLDEARISLYYGYLNHLTREKLSKVIDTIILESKFFPRVAEILDIHRRLSNIEYNVVRIEYKEKQISPEEAKKIFAEIWKRLDGRPGDRVVIKPKLEGKRGEEFEEKRRLAKERVRGI